VIWGARAPDYQGYRVRSFLPTAMRKMGFSPFANLSDTEVSLKRPGWTCLSIMLLPGQRTSLWLEQNSMGRTLRLHRLNERSLRTQICLQLGWLELIFSTQI
jgi:hypothetical protein